MKKLLLLALFAPAIAFAQAYPSLTVPTNSALTALSTVTTSQVWRLGFSTLGDAPPLLYTASASACSLNSGAGDNGSQVPSSNGNCWLASFGPGAADVREWGAKGDGSTNNTTAMQAAQITGMLIYYPRGKYLFSTISFTAGGIVGDGEASTYLWSTDTTTANVITVSATNIQPGGNAPIFQRFLLGGQSSKTSGAGILVTAPNGENQGARFENVTIYTFPTDLQFGAASNWSIQNCSFINYLNSGILVANTNNPDSGDSVIAGSLFTTAVGSTPVGIGYLSSGGLKVVGNKINGGAYGFFLGLNAPSSTSDLLLSTNSIENQRVAAIELSRQSGTAEFSNIVITGNQMAINPNGVLSDASGAFSEVSIVGNIIQLSSGSGTAIGLYGVTNFNVSSNTLKGNGGSPTGVAISSASANGMVGLNTYASFATPLTNSSSTTLTP
jgi:hypothetical protein